MGDANDAGVLILFVPLVMAPLFIIAKLVIALAFFQKRDARFWRRLIFTAIAESCLPLATLIAYLPILIFVRLFAPGLLDERWFRISSFLLLLFVAASVTNYFAINIRDWRRSGSNLAMAIAQSALLGLVPTVLFIATWLTLGRILQDYG